jgi:DNA polymerase III subunit delta
MNYETIKDQLQNGEIRNIYLLYGSEGYLIDVIVKRLQKLITGQSPSMTCSNTFTGSTDEGEIGDALRSLPLMGGKKLVICRNTGYFKGNKKREGLLALFESIPLDSFLIFIEDEADKANPQLACLSKKGNAYRIDSRSQEDLREYISGRFKKNKKIISDDNIRLFMNYSGTRLFEIESDIEKILLYMGDQAHVKPEYIRNLCSGTQEARIYELTDSICARKKHESLNLMKDLEALKVPVQVILSTLHSSFMELLSARIAIDKGRQPEIKRKGAKAADFIVRLITEKARKYSAGQLEGAVKMIAACDVSIKTGEVSDDAALELLIVHLVSL